MSARITVRNGRFDADAPRVWSEIRLADTGVLPNYDVGMDDGSIVALIPTMQPAVNQVVLIRAFPEELKRRAP
jgi:hypothetical protein